ncbi:hypothetical protein AAFF_G00304720 [Aldrovandia affinis]|uniref:Uncharacterized protein n=1 Tax=Aldrovandia affinis TaxID=143900 RepID=A0AAD7WR11_9TELE|nr:hypothetical protein AAFF_G00304720 [Aldrovandia affinis]
MTSPRRRSVQSAQLIQSPLRLGQDMSPDVLPSERAAVRKTQSLMAGAIKETLTSGGPPVGPCGTPGRRGVHHDVYPLRGPIHQPAQLIDHEGCGGGEARTMGKSQRSARWCGRARTGEHHRAGAGGVSRQQVLPPPPPKKYGHWAQLAPVLLTASRAGRIAASSTGQALRWNGSARRSERKR